MTLTKSIDVGFTGMLGLQYGKRHSLSYFLYDIRS